MLIEHDLFRGRVDRVRMVIDRMKAFEPSEGYYLAYSGGKDSDTILALAKMAGVKFDAHYNLTTVDAPETVYHVKAHPEVIIERPKETMWKLIVRKKMPPTRVGRYCCQILKESHGKGRIVMTGIRNQESYNRSKRQMVDPCRTMNKRYLHPIIDWSEGDVWEFLKGYNIPYCKLYDEGWTRIGCVMCPFGDQKLQAKRWPKIAGAYHRAILKGFDANVAAGLTASKRFLDGEQLWTWWLSGKHHQEEGGLFT